MTKKAAQTEEHLEAFGRKLNWRSRSPASCHLSKREGGT